MEWNLSQLPLVAIGAGSTVVAVLLYGVAPRLPSPVPPVFLRLLAVWLLITSTTLCWLTDEVWWHAALLGGAGLAAIGVIFLAQTRRQRAPAPAEKAVPPAPRDTSSK